MSDGCINLHRPSHERCSPHPLHEPPIRDSTSGPTACSAGRGADQLQGLALLPSLPLPFNNPAYTHQGHAQRLLTSSTPLHLVGRFPSSTGPLVARHTIAAVRRQLLPSASRLP